MGYVYHGHYLAYFETARTEFIRKIGFPYIKLEDAGIMLPVFTAGLQYKLPVKYDELMHINVKVYDWPDVRFTTYYEVCTEDNPRPHILGKVELCFMDALNRRPRRAPQDFLDQFKAYVQEYA